MRIVFFVNPDSASPAFPFVATCCILLATFGAVDAKLPTALDIFLATKDAPALTPPVPTVETNVPAPVATAPTEAVILPASAAPAAMPTPAPISAPVTAPIPIPAQIFLPLLAAEIPPTTAPTAAPTTAVIAKNGRCPVASDIVVGLFAQYVNRF